MPSNNDVLDKVSKRPNVPDKLLKLFQYHVLKFTDIWLFQLSQLLLHKCVQHFISNTGNNQCASKYDSRNDFMNIKIRILRKVFVTLYLVQLVLFTLHLVQLVLLTSYLVYLELYRL